MRPFNHQPAGKEGISTQEAWASPPGVIETVTRGLLFPHISETGKQKKAFASSFVFIQCFLRQSIVHA
jgi:hypothetical protein